MKQNSPTILIAEDDPVLREAYLRRFARTPFTIVTAENGDAAMQMIRKNPPDLLICDLRMPIHDGWWVLEQLRERHHDFPVLVLTNLDDDETVARLKTFFIDGYLVKKNMTLRSLTEKAAELLEPSSSTPQ